MLLFVSMNYCKAQGSLVIQSEPALDSVINRNIEMHRNNNFMEGYRIQIFTGSERNNANSIKAKFTKEYPDVPAYLLYQQPYFKVRIGDFRNKIEAQYLYRKLLNEYGQVLIVPDKINFPKL